MINEGDSPKDLFQLHECIGTGSYGKVYRATRRADNEQLAIKVLPLADGGIKAISEKMKQELMSLRDCQHPRVIAYHGAFLSSTKLWIAMEYCLSSLHAVMSTTGEPLTEMQIAYVCQQALWGLEYLHNEMHMIHRDVKAANILLTTSGEVRLADFGVAAQVNGQLMMRSTIVGTPNWMSPEMIDAGCYDQRTDIWSLGITAIELAQMKPPHSDVRPAARVLYLIPKSPPPTLANPGNWSPYFPSFLEACLQKQPDMRASASEALAHEFAASAPHSSDVLLSLVQVEKERIISHRLSAASRSGHSAGESPLHKGSSSYENTATNTWTNQGTATNTGPAPAEQSQSSGSRRQLPLPLPRKLDWLGRSARDVGAVAGRSARDVGAVAERARVLGGAVVGGGSTSKAAGPAVGGPGAEMDPVQRAANDARETQEAFAREIASAKLRSLSAAKGFANAKSTTEALAAAKKLAHLSELPSRHSATPMAPKKKWSIFSPETWFDSEAHAQSHMNAKQTRRSRRRSSDPGPSFGMPRSLSEGSEPSFYSGSFYEDSANLSSVRSTIEMPPPRSLARVGAPFKGGGLFSMGHLTRSAPATTIVPPTPGPPPPSRSTTMEGSWDDKAHSDRSVDTQRSSADTESSKPKRGFAWRAQPASAPPSSRCPVSWRHSSSMPSRPESTEAEVEVAKEDAGEDSDTERDTVARHDTDSAGISRSTDPHDAHGDRTNAERDRSSVEIRDSVGGAAQVATVEVGGGARSAAEVAGVERDGAGVQGAQPNGLEERNSVEPTGGAGTVRSGFHIYVKSVEASKLIFVKPSDSIATVKDKIEGSLGVPHEQQRLMYSPDLLKARMAELSDDKTVADSQISAGSMLSLKGRTTRK